MGTTPIYNDLTLLHNRREDIKNKINDLNCELKVINNSLQQMFEDQARIKLAEKGKDFGQSTIVSGDHKVTIDIRRRVEWDQELLTTLLNQMDPEDARHYATAKYSIAEAKFQNATPEVKAALSEARTVFLQGFSVDIKEVENA